MNFPLNIITLILAYYLKRPFLGNEVPQHWKKFFNSVMGIAAVLLILDAVEILPELLTLTASLILSASVIYVTFTYAEFKLRKPMIWAWLPIIIVESLSRLTETISESLYDTLDIYFQVAGGFAFLWGIAMWINNKKQAKALEIERIKALAQEQDLIASRRLKEQLEIQVAERTIALTNQKEELQKALDELKSMQDQLIQSEKMASLGELTAGIAHEIQNPLNFVNNFSEVSNELLHEIIEERAKAPEERDPGLEDEILQDLSQNLQKINHHGKRADSIVKGMLQHSRSNSGQKELTDINEIADEYLRLSYHGLRARDKSFNADFKMELDPNLPKLEVVPQEIGRVLLNLINNGFYAATEKKNELKAANPKAQDSFMPTVWVKTKALKKGIEIRVRDNGNGITDAIKAKIFQPFFTTKPTGKGTGLGLSMSYEIITKGHSGQLTVESQPGEYTEFIIILP